MYIFLFKKKTALQRVPAEKKKIRPYLTLHTCRLESSNSCVSTSVHRDVISESIVTSYNKMLKQRLDAS